MGTPVPVIKGAKSVKGRKIVKNDQDPLLWLVGASISGQRDSRAPSGLRGDMTRDPLTTLSPGALSFRWEFYLDNKYVLSLAPFSSIFIFFKKPFRRVKKSF
jgi:hypothetical protein